MKKFGKFVFAALSVTALAGSAYYLVKNVINKDSSDDFDDFEEEFEDLDLNDEGEADPPTASENREYVTLNLNKEETETSVQKEPEAEAPQEQETSIEDTSSEETE